VKKTWISISQAGMGDRLVCFASSLRRDEDALIYWPIQKKELERPFNHLFNYEGHITEYNKIPGVTTWGNWRLWLNKEEKEKYGYQDYKYNLVPQEIRDVYVPIFQRIKNMIRDDIKEEVKNHIKKLGNVVVGIHLRTFEGKHYYNGSWDNDHEGVINLFKSAMDKFPKSTKFLLATDDERATSELEKDYNIVELENRGLWDQKFDLVEALVLSNCKNLMLTAMSHYSELIWWFADAHNNVIPLYPKAQIQKTGFIPDWIDNSLFTNEYI
tara:strand:+ start:152 stop:961 length:810 start_codon:yes stop_codon:yes gene_type:complete